MFHVRTPTRSDLAILVGQQTGQPVSYGPIGATRSIADPPPGFHRLDVQRRIGFGRDRFETAKAAIVLWAGHRRAGATLEPKRPTLEVDNDVALALRVWPVWVTATCRIVQVIDEPYRFGFAYGTLPHHPACGEERFIVTRDPSTDEVRLQVVAVSRPSTRLARFGGPIGRAFQRFTAERYLDGFEHWAPEASPAKPIERNLTSWRWWFENRQQGGLTIAQFPNWPLFGIATAAVARRLTADGSAVQSGTGWLIAALWLYWGSDELLRGVNPWRRLLGALVLGWLVARSIVS